MSEDRVSLLHCRRTSNYYCLELIVIKETRCIMQRDRGSKAGAAPLSPHHNPAQFLPRNS
jgi:hypothetical protein